MQYWLTAVSVTIGCSLYSGVEQILENNSSMHSESKMKERSYQHRSNLGLVADIRRTGQTNVTIMGGYGCYRNAIMVQPHDYRNHRYHSKGKLNRLEGFLQYALG